MYKKLMATLMNLRDTEGNTLPPSFIVDLYALLEERHDQLQSFPADLTKALNLTEDTSISVVGTLWHHDIIRLFTADNNRLVKKEELDKEDPHGGTPYIFRTNPDFFQ